MRPERAPDSAPAPAPTPESEVAGDQGASSERSDATKLAGVGLDASGDPNPDLGILGTIGNTPLIRLRRLGAGLPCPILAKLESANPGGSVKDRVALSMVLDAERRGLLQPGGVIVEPTSGNTGIGLALVAAARGYRLMVVTTPKTSLEKIAILESYGAEVTLAELDQAPDSPSSIYGIAQTLAARIPGAFLPDQYSNLANPRAHETGTGPEIWKQSRGRVTAFICGIGTGGTVTGVARALRRQRPDVKIFGVDPPGSVHAGGGGRTTQVEGIGADFVPSVFDRSVVDEILRVSDEESIFWTRLLARDEGVFTGASAGAALAGARRVAARLGPDDVLVTLFPDGGERYLSKYHCADWVSSSGLDAPKDAAAEATHPVRQSGGSGPDPRDEADLNLQNNPVHRRLARRLEMT